jgi:hypothetical protein
MIIPESREKVKKKAISLVNQLRGNLSKPIRKFVLEMSMGMLMTGTCNVNLIAGALGERIDPRHTLKRLHRMLLNWQILIFANRLSLKEASKKVGEKTILALDGGELTHQYGNKFEKSAKVRDGSNGGALREGYWLNQVSGYNPSTRETFPIMLYIYSVLEQGFKSANIETFKIVDKVIDRLGDLGLWVIDRGYDGGEVLRYFFGKGLDFMLRMRKTRNIIYEGKSENIYKRARQINRRIKYSKYSRFGSCKVFLELNGVRYEATLICYKDKRNKGSIIFLTNGWIKNTKELKRRIRGYFYRWGVEDSYRFEKQSFELEKSQTRNYNRIKTLVGLTIISWLILIRVNEEPKLKEVVLKQARMEKDKLKDRPKFIYYRLLRGIQRIFAGIKDLFRFRLKRKDKQKLRENLIKEFPLLRNTAFIDEYLEEVA